MEDTSIIEINFEGGNAVATLEELSDALTTLKKTSGVIGTEISKAFNTMCAGMKNFYAGIHSVNDAI